MSYYVGIVYVVKNELLPTVAVMHGLFSLSHKIHASGSGCGSVGRAVTFDTRGPRFDSSHRQNCIEHLFVNLSIINCIEKMKINKKRLGMAHF